jgi:hypothetical protein
LSIRKKFIPILRYVLIALFASIFSQNPQITESSMAMVFDDIFRFAITEDDKLWVWGLIEYVSHGVAVFSH